MTDYGDVIAAFVDNEPVRADDLSAALASSEGREYLIDLLVLRRLVGDPSVKAHGAPGLQSRGAIAGHPPRGRRIWLTAAAAVLVAGVAGGFFAGRGTRAGTLVPNPHGAIDVSQTTGAAVRPAPAPTHVIRMEKGVDWNERSGGN